MLFLKMNARFFSSIACLACLVLPLGLAAQQPVKKQTSPVSKPAAAASAPSQNEAPILLVNPGFEDVPKAGEAPTGWFECGAPGETPPDIQPGYFSVAKPPQQGNSYLGLVVRDNETVEGVSQRLSRPLEANKCFTWSLQLCRSELYLSPSKTAPQTENVNYTTPVKLRVWGGSGYCNKKELLAETSAVQNTRWLQYDFRLQPKQTHTYIFIEAYYKTPVLFFYNGNIMVDNAGPIQPIPCKEPPKPPKPPVQPPTPPTTPPIAQNGPKTNPTQTTVPPVFSDRLKVGEIIRVEKIQFDADRADVKPESYPAMDEMFRFLTENKKVVVEIGGHTNNLPTDDFCDELSANRAKAVADFLVSKGIEGSRVKYKGYGKRYPISPNTTKEGRRKNQRVEVKILSVG